VIVAVGVNNQPPDAEHLEPMLERIAASADALPEVMTMDAGYWSEDNAKACSNQSIDAYIATGRLPHGPATTAETRPDPQRCRCQSPDGPQVQKQGRIKDLRQAQSDRGAGEWTDQRGSRPAPLSAAMPREG
jgi:hypothetical protein